MRLFQTSLKEIDLPQSIISIDSDAFSHCSSLKVIDVPPNIESINQSVFSACTSLTCVNLQQKITALYAYAFQDCISLKSITLHEGITLIGYNCFLNCTSLKSIIIPSTVKFIEKNAFERMILDEATINYNFDFADIQFYKTNVKQLTINGIVEKCSYNSKLLSIDKIIYCHNSFNAIDYYQPDFEETPTVYTPGTYENDTFLGLTVTKIPNICKNIPEPTLQPTTLMQTPEQEQYPTPEQTKTQTKTFSSGSTTENSKPCDPTPIDDKSRSENTKLIVGISVGSVALIAVIVVIIIIIIKSRKQKYEMFSEKLIDQI